MQFLISVDCKFVEFTPILNPAADLVSDPGFASASAPYLDTAGPTLRGGLNSKETYVVKPDEVIFAVT